MRQESDYKLSRTRRALFYQQLIYTWSGPKVTGDFIIRSSIYNDVSLHTYSRLRAYIPRRSDRSGNGVSLVAYFSGFNNIRV